VYGVPQQGARFGALDGHLHFTFMQMIGFDVYPGLALPADYGNVAHVDNSMTRIYDEMEAREATAIAEHGFNHDPTSRGEQAQRCLAAYTLCTYDNFHAFASLDLLMGRLQEAYGEAHVLCRLRPDRNHVLFGHLHMTFMQLLGFDVYGTVALPKDYSEVLESVLLRALRPFEVQFTRVAVTRASVLLVGHPTVGLNHVRKQARDALARVGYPLYEPCKNDIAHVTLMRFGAPLQATEYDALHRMARCSGPGRMFASLAVDALDASAASWKMQPAESEGVQCVELSR